MKVIVVGGVAGGASCAARLRRLNENAEIIMYEKGPYVSFSNCGLPYHISGEIKNEADLIMMTPSGFKGQFNIQARVNCEVIKVNTATKTVTVLNHQTKEEYTETYDKLVVSPGAKSIVPPFEGMDKVNIYTLKTVPDVSKIVAKINQINAKKAVVIGGGFIGVEAAENLKLRGLDVTLIEGTNQIMAPLDIEMSFYLSKELMNKGVKVILEDLVTKFDTNKVCLKSGLEIDADVVILAIGVAPDTAFLKDSGIDMTDRGYINVDENYKTNCADVYAAGDAILVHWPLSNEIAPLALAGPANKQGRLIADAIMGRKVLNTGYIGTSCIKVFDYNAANVGLNEKSLKRLGMNYNVCYTAAYDMVSIMPHANPMFFKLIYNNDGKILGAQAVGKGSVDKRIDVIATAIKGNLTIYDLCDLELSYAPPFGTGKDIINKTGYVATNLNDGLYKQVLFTQVYDLVKEGAQIIDVREILELQAGAGTIKGAKNIPLSVLRDSLDQIDKSKPVYVHCKTGQRSYNAALMLQTYGFDAYNIAGSYDYVVIYEEGMHNLDSSRENILV